MHFICWNVVQNPFWCFQSSFLISVQKSCFSFSMLKSSWSSLERVFLIRKAVRRAVGFWYQHSFMTFTMADNILKRQKKYKTPHFQNVIVLLRSFLCLLVCVCLCQIAYWVRMESVVQTGPLLVHTHHLFHLLKAGIRGHQVKEGWTVIFHNA